MSSAVLNSPFLMRLLTSGEEDIKHVSMLKDDTSSTACELTMLILSISVTLNVTCLTVASLITKSCQQRWQIHSCSFYKVVHVLHGQETAYICSIKRTVSSTYSRGVRLAGYNLTRPRQN